MRKLLVACISLGLLFAGNVLADQKAEHFKRVLQGKFASVKTPLQIESVEAAEIPGFYTVQLNNGPLLYVSEDGNYFFAGELYQFKAGRMVNITEQDSSRSRAVMMEQLNTKEMVVFSPKLPVKTKAHITVFTDVDCFYCQKLHKEVPELNARGIEVRYMAFPRAGVASATAKKLISAWCNANPQDSITRLKNRQTIEEATCDNPVAKQYELGKRMGVTGTPAILLPDGEMIPGYRPAKDLAEILGV